MSKIEQQSVSTAVHANQQKLRWMDPLDDAPVAGYFINSFLQTPQHPEAFYDRDVVETYRPLACFHLINRAIETLKGSTSDGQRGWSAKKVGAYLGYRIVTYLFIPTILNLVSLLVCAVLSIVTLPTRCLNAQLNQWCWTKCQGSFAYLAQSLYDLTADARWLSAKLPCCHLDPRSPYLHT